MALKCAKDASAIGYVNEYSMTRGDLKVNSMGWFVFCNCRNIQLKFHGKNELQIRFHDGIK